MKINAFKIVTLLTAVLFAYLFFTLFFTSDQFMQGIGLQPSLTSQILARRTAFFMLGISVLMFGSIRLPLTKARQIICVATAVTLLGLSTMSCYEFVRETLNSSIVTAAIIEAVLGISFALIFIVNRKKV